jgi:uncharacterized protein DUF4357
MTQGQQRPFSIRIFVPDGDPDGLRLVEKSNWTGVGVVFNRTNYKQVVRRPEFARTGVYVLVGTSDDSALPTIYVGEGDPVKDRLNMHYSKKDFWEWAAFFVSKDSSLNKAHVQRMECRLIELAQAAKQCKLDNGNCPTAPTLSEAEVADVESFLLDVLSVFPLIGLGVFERTEARKSARELLWIDSKGIKASGFESARGLVVCKGSQAVKEEVPSIQRYVTTLRKDLIEQGVMAANGQHYIFTQDHVFSSPSTAAGVICGGLGNGMILWKSSDGTTLKELQARAADSADAPA